MEQKLETHQEALKRLKLELGDTVKVIEKAESNTRGWSNSWSSEMDYAIGKTGTVINIHTDALGVSLLIPNIEFEYNYPAFVLEKVIKESKPSTTTSSTTVMDEAKGLIYGDREKDYGRTTDNFKDIAKGWEVITKATITPEQVGLMMAWLKICRANQDNCEKRDSLIDLCGYAGCIEKVKKGL